MSNKQDNTNQNKEGLSPLGEAIDGILPELMNRNIKLGDRLKSKLRVSSLLNNIELRNQNYLKELVSSSDRNVQDLKSGLKLSKAMKLSSNKLSKLNSKILNDCFMKKNNIIINTKKTLKKNTEEETNMIIKKSINILRECISPTSKVQEKPQIETNYKKYLSKSELTDVKKLINNKISEDETILKNKIKNYLDKVSGINITNSRNSDLYDYKLQKLNKDKNKNFYIYAKYFSLNDTDLKMINYEKRKPQPIRDKSCPNLENIKENLFPEIKTGKINDENYVNINNSNGVRIINGMKRFRKIRKKNISFTQDEKDININDIVVNNKKDSFNILKKIIIRNRSLINKTCKKYDKLSSIMDIKLPKISEYETMVVSNNKMIKEKNQNDNNDINNDVLEENNEIYNIAKKRRNKSEIYKNFSNWELIKEFKDLKDEIQILKNKKVDIEENYIKHREDLMDMVFNFDKKQNQNRINNKDYLIDNKGLINKKIFVQNPMIRLPSSHSVSVLKRKFKINSGNNNEYQKINKKIRNYSNHTRDKTSASSIKNSVSSIFTTSKSENKFKELFNYINIDKKKNILSNSTEVPSLLSPKKYSSDNTKNNAPSDNITIMSDY